MSIGKTNSLNNIPGEVLAGLYAVAMGQLQHVYNGACPDVIEGLHVRDDECPACQALLAADKATRDAGIALPQYFQS